jgi:hypothetical protein
MEALASCRTSSLGGHLERCGQCGFEQPVYNSCGNRNCPTCQGKLARKWLSARLADLLNTSYFHCVFTIPDTFNVLVPYNETVIYNLLFKAASGTLKHFAKRDLGGQPGMVGVLHTWGQTLWLHPHVHFLMTGGALSDDHARWRSTGPDFLFDVYQLSADFRKRFCKLLRRARLVFRGDSESYADRTVFEAFVSGQEARPWIVYAKKPFSGPAQVLEYISRYTHRVAISNRRIIDVSADGEIAFTWKDYRSAPPDGPAPERIMQLGAIKFIGRFLRHILPRGFRKIRSYGILAGKNRTEKIAAARVLLGPAELPETSGEDTDSPELCPECGEGTMKPFASIPSAPPPKVIMKWIFKPDHHVA